MAGGRGVADGGSAGGAGSVAVMRRGASRLPPLPHVLQQGYTLIEVLVAFAILALALTLLLGGLSGASRQVRWADDAGRASLHAQSLLDDVGVGTVLQEGHRDGVFEQGRYRWSLDVEPYVDPLLPPDAFVDP